MLKNHNNALPVKAKSKVYVPKRFVKAVPDWWGNVGKDYWEYPVNLDLVKKYFEVVDTPEEADFSIVFIESPNGGAGYSEEDRKNGGNGYIPISLQYSDYTATEAREKSIAGGDPFESFTNRSYKNKSVTTYNKTDLDLVVDTKRQMGEKPVIVSVCTRKPFVPKEIEPFADAILINFDTQAQCILDIVKGNFEPSGLLPVQMPADMETVEHQLEDVPLDMIPYKDADGHIYDFAFGLNWSGVIKDARTDKYKHNANTDK